MNRYARQIALPEIGLTGQEKLKNACIAMVGAGGLGAPALPYLAAAGIGNITIIDHDTVDLHNLHRQTIYTTAQAGQNKAELAGAYLSPLNPDITINVISEKLTADNAQELLGAHDITLLLDGSDNFTTKSLLNDLSIALQIPLITASVNSFGGQIGIFEGYKETQACYRCLFPEFPLDARNCNDTGILGTSAGIIGMTQAHLALCYLLELDTVKSGQFYTFDLKSLRTDCLNTHKDPSCPHCQNKGLAATKPKQEKRNIMADLISIETLNDEPTIIVDVRQPEELLADPVRNPLIQETPLHIPLPELLARRDELPTDKRIAFLCAGNIRSRQAADYFSAQGMENVCVLDKFSL